MSEDGMIEVRRRIAEEAEKKTGELDLSNLGLTDFPEEIFELDNLFSLILGRESHNHRPNSLGENLTKLRKLPEVVLIDWTVSQLI